MEFDLRLFFLGHLFHFSELNFAVSSKPVILIGATSRLESLDFALRRPGRFGTEVCVDMPDERSRQWYVLFKIKIGRLCTMCLFFL